MLVPPLLVAYLVFASLSLLGLAFLLYIHDPHSSELRFSSVLMFLVGVVLLVFALPLWVDVGRGTVREELSLIP